MSPVPSFAPQGYQAACHGGGIEVKTEPTQRVSRSDRQFCKHILCSDSLNRVSFAQHSANHKTDIGGSFAETPHEVREPFTPEWNVDAHTESIARERRLQ